MIALGTLKRLDCDGSRLCLAGRKFGFRSTSMSFRGPSVFSHQALGQAKHPLAIPAGLHALRIDPHNAGGAIAAVDPTLHHDARRNPTLWVTI